MMALSNNNDQYLRHLLADFGTPTGESGLHYLQQAFTGDGVTTVFTLSHTPSSDQPPQVFLATVLQQSPSNYSISGTSLTFVIAPTNLVAIQVVYDY